ncbi:MAG: efflux RND transporter periplasmic adaptor subunit [Calditrichaeota bacterium]|nr:efflux RND transporter periplasmic adaptor subunit [Calditrichota bacterium]RQW03327.1 MAG: efflux RND transporter periplasmic adaptor subunit [Calditrichota bacterium]
MKIDLYDVYQNKYDLRVSIMIKLLVVLAMFLVIGCGTQDGDRQLAVGNQQTVTVSVTKVQKLKIGEKIKIFGDIHPFSRIDVYSRVGGLITSEYTSIGEKVSEGDVLAEVLQDIPGMEYSPVKIEATLTGVISMDAVEAGSRITPQQKLYTIQNIDKVTMMGKVLESALPETKAGQILDIRVDAFPNQTFRGKIIEIYPTVNPETRMGELKILIDNSGYRLKPGMFARTELIIKEHRALAVPLDALVRKGANTYVYKIENNEAIQIKVKTGATQGDLIEIVNNLQEGDSVVVLGQNLLNDGTSVRVVEAD